MAAPKGNKFSTGRPKGVKNKVQGDIKALIQSRGQDLIDGAIDIFENPDSQDMKLKAIQLLLDRGYGKPTQQTNLGFYGQMPDLKLEISKTDAGKSKS